MVRTSQKVTSNHSLISSTTMKFKSIMKAVLLIGGLTFATASCTNKNDEPVIETNQYIHKGVVAGKSEMKIDVKTIYIITSLTDSVSTASLLTTTNTRSSRRGW